jgi:hypothetical protein
VGFPREIPNHQHTKCRREGEDYTNIVKASFGKKEGTANLLEICLDFIGKRKSQHAVIEKVVDEIFDTYEGLYGAPTWIIEQKSIGDSV